MVSTVELVISRSEPASARLFPNALTRELKLTELLSVAPVIRTTGPASWAMP